MALPTFKEFVIHEDENVGSRWDRYIQRLDNMFVALDISNEPRKKALLLHYVGEEINEIVETLNFCQEETEENCYTNLCSKLKEHFRPKFNKRILIFKFRSSVQGDNESVEEYVIRLRGLASKCDFRDVEEEITNQLIFTIKNKHLQRKALEDNLSLDKIVENAKAMHLVDNDLKVLQNRTSNNPETTIQAIQQRQSAANFHQSTRADNKPPKRQGAANYASQKMSCSRCSSSGHTSSCLSCPARDKQCHKCQLTGHFAKCCRTKTTSVRDGQKYQRPTTPTGASFSREQRPSASHSHGSQYKQRPSPSGHVTTKKRHVNLVDNGDCVENKVHLFTISENNKNSVVSVKFDDNFKLDMIIDSGAAVNIVDKKTFELLCKSGIKCDLVPANIKLYPYASKEPLCILGKFSCNLQCHGRQTNAEIYVLDCNEESPSLLGKSTAEKLKIIQIATKHYNEDYDNEEKNFVNSIEEEIFKKYPDVFNGVGKLKDYKLKLHVNENVIPVSQSMYRIPYSLVEKVNEKLIELEENDIIEEVNEPSKWVSPMIVIPKKNQNSVRLVVDMRKANLAIEREKHPLPTVDEILCTLNEAKCFSKLDLKDAFHQIELEEGISREITTFTTPRGLRRYKRLIMGVNSAPEKYHNVISQIFQDIDGVISMYDDICVYGKTIEEHDANLLKVMNRMREKNLTLNKTKCQFRLTNIQFMGHEISAEGIRPTKDHVKALENAERPKNISEVRSFLGLANYSARYIQNFSTIAEPLRKLTRAKCMFSWGSQQEESFQKLKKCLTTDTVLGHFSLKADKTELICDASNVGLCSILVQTLNGKKRIISYAARTLSDVEKRYSTTEKEALGVVWACEKFRLYLLGLEFEITVDHKALEYIYSPKSKPCARVERWVLRLMPFNFTIKSVPGRNNIADALSRLVKKEPQSLDENSTSTEQFVNFVANNAVPYGLSLEEIGEETLKDQELINVREAMHTDVWGEETKVYNSLKNELMEYKNVLLRGHRIIIPQSLRGRCLKLAHEGHLGIVATKQRLRTKVWWYKIDQDTEKYVKKCHECQLVQNYPNPEPLQPTTLPSQPWQLVSMDFLGPIEGEGYVLVVIDLYSRFYEVAITKKKDSKSVIESLKRIFVTHGYPETLMSDNAQEFTSNEMKVFLQMCNIRQRLVTPLHPAANGEVERQNRSLLKRMRIAKASGKDWKQEIYNYLFAYRNTPHSVTGMPPAELFFKRKLRTKLPDISLYSENAVDEEEVRDRDKFRKMNSKCYVDDKRRAVDRDLQIGDRVLLRQKRQSKLDTPYEIEPYRLVQKFGNSCVVQSERDPNAKYKRNSTHVAKYRYQDDNLDRFQNVNFDNTMSYNAYDYRSNDVVNNAIYNDVNVNDHVENDELETETVDQNDQNTEIITPPLPQSVLRKSTRLKKHPVRFEDEFSY